jgi:hypothetical protein
LNDDQEGNMLPHEQLIFGIAAGLAFCALLRWTPLLRELLAATAVAGLFSLVISEPTRRGTDFAAVTVGLPHELLSHPHFCLGVVLAFASVLAVLHVFRTR